MNNSNRPNKCSQCQIECKPDGHHPDYDKPFEVIYLCRSCHRLIHQKFGAGKNKVCKYKMILIRMDMEDYKELRLQFEKDNQRGSRRSFNNWIVERLKAKK